MKKTTIYTRTGDNGTTLLAGGSRVSKDHPRVEAYGTLDELNAHLGLLATAIHDSEQKTIVTNTINNIFTIGCYLAQEQECTCPITQESITQMENEIDRISAQLPPMHQFLLPIGNAASMQANLCRAVCRRAERRIITLSQTAEIPNKVIEYINRLSDYLFQLHRLLNIGAEKEWEKHWK